MRDPYDILGVKRGASFDEIKAAYRRACKERHPDLGGSHEAMVELNTAYAFILEELKSGYQQRREEAPQHEEARRDEERDRRSWEQTYRDIDEELEEMRRTAQAHEEALRTMRSRAWEAGERATWAKLTWEDIARFVRAIARSGVKGLALLFAALVGVGSVLVEANVVSALILLGAGVGFACSLALKSDKGGILSAALLLFGVMTIWLPPVRAALFLYPLATISVVILLALIFKFAQAGGAVGLMTGGVLALYVVGVIVNDTAARSTSVASHPPDATAPMSPARPPSEATNLTAPAVSAHSSPQTVSPTGAIQAKPAPPPPSPRTLLASPGAILKLVAGVPYRLKVRTGHATELRTTQGRIALSSDDADAGVCTDAFDFPVEAGAGPWREIEQTLRACGSDSILLVTGVN